MACTLSASGLLPLKQHAVTRSSRRNSVCVKVRLVARVLKREMRDFFFFLSLSFLSLIPLSLACVCVWIQFCVLFLSLKRGVIITRLKTTRAQEEKEKEKEKEGLCVSVLLRYVFVCNTKERKKERKRERRFGWWCLGETSSARAARTRKEKRSSALETAGKTHKRQEKRKEEMESYLFRRKEMRLI